MTKRLLFFAYGTFCYVLFLGTFLYGLAFIGNFAVPRTLDGPATRPVIQALAINLGLLGLFAVQHSVMARRWFKARWTRIVATPIERSTYVLCSSLALLLLFWQWQPLGGEVWSVDSPFPHVTFFGLFMLGWMTVLATTFMINHVDLFGLRQVWFALHNRPYEPLAFKTPGLYTDVRHPLYLGWLLAFWMTPTMTVTHLLFAVATTASSCWRSAGRSRISFASTAIPTSRIANRCR